MSWNLLVWKWAEEFNTPTKRKKAKLKFSNITGRFAENGDHPAIGEADLSSYLEAVFERFGEESPNLPFIVERYEKCVVFNYADRQRAEVVPILGNLAMSRGLNASEF